MRATERLQWELWTGWRVACCRCTIGHREGQHPAEGTAAQARLALARNARLREPSAAQNVTVNPICTQCGAVNGAEANVCLRCKARLTGRPEARRVAGGIPEATAGNLAIAQDWRGEVSHRVEAYRTRRRQFAADPAQPGFSFAEDAAAPSGPPTDGVAAQEPVLQSWHYRPRRLERFEIDVAQPAFDFPGEQHCPAGALAKPQTLLLVASLGDRRHAGQLDTAILLFTFGGFLTLFAALGGHFDFSKMGLVVTAATFGLFYTQYFTLFTFFGGATPGMMLRRLRVVTFDGAVPTAQQMLWRSFGYVVSAGTMMLGFVWALWDDDHLCWHDRISQTYLTIAVAGSTELQDAPRKVPNSQRGVER
jgi:uncharacterized RDD family membrane protein YckC/ribosomal protein L40E